jgi:predicted  nucleic acid-binding Zn-ribbon protein
MADIVLLKNKLQGLSDKIKTKDALGKDYKKIVSESLARIKAKITKILADHNKQVQDITKGSAENLEKTRAELTAQQARLKQASDAALEAAKRNQDKLQNNLADTNKQLNDLQAELNKANPDTQNMQVIIEKLRQDLQSAQNDSAAANDQIAQLTERLRAYDGIKERMDELVKNLLAKIGDILAQVDAMSINQGDITELLRLLNETEDMFPKDDGSPPGDGGEGGIFGNLFGGPSDAGAGSGARSIYAAPQSNSAGGPGKPGNYPTGPLFLKGNQPFIPKNGGKTRRRRGKKTMHRGGYVEKLRAKKSRRRSQTSKRRSGRRSTASSASSSASSNSRQKAMQARKM